MSTNFSKNTSHTDSSISLKENSNFKNSQNSNHSNKSKMNADSSKSISDVDSSVVLKENLNSKNSQNSNHSNHSNKSKMNTDSSKNISDVDSSMVLKENLNSKNSQNSNHSDQLNLKNGLFFASIGGSEQIGMNCTLYICDEQILIVDLGIGFSDDIPGVQVVVPDLSFIFARKNKVVGIVITHIHEDHCGALSYLLKYLPQVNIYASRFAINFIKAKLEENQQNIQNVNFVQIADGEDVEIYNFNVEFVNLTHSTLEMMALYIKTKYGSIFHTGDWKMDEQPVLGKPIDYKKLQNIGEEGVDLMVCDSTNVTVAGHSKSEGSLHDSFYEIIKNAQHRVIITMFASNVARISTIMAIAKKLNKKICLVGRAIWRVFNAAIESGYLEDFEGSMILNEVEASGQKPENLIIVCTGCQSEETAALTKIVNGKHRHIRLLQNDLVIFSSKTIPGNERKIYDTYNKIVKSGVKLIVQDAEHHVHVSGHPACDEVRKMYQLIKPKISIPVHGEALHTIKHAQIATEMGAQKVLTVDNGEVIKISKELNQVRKIANIKSGFLCVDGKLFRRESDPVLKTRKKIMEDGFLMILITINRKDRSNFAQIKIFSPGLLDEINDYSITNDFIAKLEREINNLVKTNDRKTDFFYVAMNFAKKFCRNRLGKDPLVKVDTVFI